MLSRRIVVGAFAALSLSAQAFAHPHSVLTNEQHGDIERQIMAFRAALKDAVVARDAARLKGMYAESFTHTHGSGKVDGRDARIVSLLTDDPTIEMASASELSLRVHGPDMVVLTGKSPIRNSRECR
ncbi:MAG: nuclear transport factor 2 family protein [Novosphingobium sp.]|nr:nuclear transport factor 2 family protein [Novosphingobium sp.]